MNTARLTGNVAGGMKVFNRCGWLAEPDSGTSLSHQYSLMAGQGVPGGLVADLRQVVFSQTGHFHDGIAVNAVPEHGTGYFQCRFALTF